MPSYARTNSNTGNLLPVTVVCCQYLNDIKQLVHGLFFFFAFAFFGKDDLLVAQNYLANVQFYNHENGLAGRFANCTFKDSRGLVWIGTQFGLNRFDGRDFLLFNEASGLPFPQVMEIHEDSEGWLWLFRNCRHKQGCTRNLAFLHSVTHEVHTFEEHFGDSVDFGPEDAVSIVSNEKGDVFLSAKQQVVQWLGGGIGQKIDLSNLEATPKLLSLVGADRLAGWYLAEDKTGNVQLIHLVFDLDGKTQHSQVVPNLGKKNSRRELQMIGRDHRGRKMVGHHYAFGASDPHFVLLDDGRLLRDTSAWTNYPIPQGYDPFRPAAWQIGSDGLNVYTFTGGLAYRFGDEFPELGKDPYTRQIRFDEDNVAWLSGRLGVFRIELKPNPFQRILHNPLPDFEAGMKHICQGVVSAGDGILLLSTQGFGFYEKQTATPSPPIKLEEKKQASTPVAMTKGYRGDYWGVQYSVMYRTKKEGGVYSIERRPFEKGNGFQKTLSQYFEENRLWLGTDQGLHYFDHAQRQIFEMVAYNGFEELKENTIHQIYEESEDRLWLCTSNGLYLFSLENGIQAHYWEGGTGQFKIPGTSFYQIHPSRRGGWWLASKQGLVYWDPADNKSKLFTTEEGLVSNVILMVHEDGHGFLWLATDQGLIQFQTGTGRSKVWLEAEGVSSHDFEPYSYYCQEYGTVWFGSTNGYTVFHPRDFKDIDFTAQPDVPLNILDFEQFSSESKNLENKTQELIQDQQIILNPGEQLFNLRVALADYVSGEDAQYAYRIEGVQDFWQEGKENLIRISGLPYGDFNLEIRGRLANGQYSSNEIHLPVRVLKPFYLKTWFLLVSGMGLLGAILLGFVWRTTQLKRQQAILQKMVKERTRTIEQQAEDLKSLEKLKSRFFANVSHELRTPLTLMLGPVQSLLRLMEKGGEEKKLLRFVQRNAQQLLKLVNEILDLSKLEDNKLEVTETPVHFYPYLKNQMAQFHSFAASNQLEFGLDFRVDKSLQILLDKNKFEKIIHNFLSNALKFTPPSGKVTLAVEQMGNQLQVSVSDSGRGIHPDDLPHIFDRFYQSKQPDAKTEGGTGIGLSLCKELAELLGGEVWAESDLGKGSVFYFQFPKKKITLGAAPLRDGPEGKQEGVISKLATSSEPEMTPFPLPANLPLKDATSGPGLTTILIVEDNHDLREYLTYLLSEYHVLTAENGKEALEILNGEILNYQFSTINLIISDLMMPVMDGFQFLEKLKADDRWRHLPTLMLTAKVNARAKLKALRIGVDDYLTKPFQEEELLVRVENLLANHLERLAFDQTSETSGTQKPEHLSPAEDTQWLEGQEGLLKKELGNAQFFVAQWAEQLDMSERQLQRKLKQLTGLSPHRYLLEMRLDEARRLLENRHCGSVTEVAGTVGFSHLKTFSRNFQKRFGRMPSGYF